MEELYLFAQDLLAERIPALGTIDEDYGQVEAMLNGSSDTYPITFPAALIGNMSIDWNDVGGGIQTGRCLFTVRLFCECLEDTHRGSGTESSMRNRLALNNEVYLALQGKALQNSTDYFARVKQADYFLPGAIKVYETVFGFDIHDDAAFKDYARQREPDRGR